MNPTPTTATLTANRLSDRHYKECVTKRGLSPEWIAANCRSMDIKEATQRLGYKAQSPGIWLEGVNGFGQYRPNQPWKSTDEKKAPKYRTATKEEYDAMLPRHPHNPRYWDDLAALKPLCYQINGHPCLLLTEGLFKAICGCSHDLPTVALAGVEQGLTPAHLDPQGKRYLVATLELLARANFGWIIAFDADDNAVTNKNVILAQRKLAHQLAKFKVPVYIATGNWTTAQGKGMDDYIQANGDDAFREKVLAKAVNLEVWERQFRESEIDNKMLSESAFAAFIAENYRNRLAWHVANKAWYWYEAEQKQGVWGEIPHEEAQDIIVTELRSRRPDFSYRFVANTLNLLKGDLRINHWEVCPGFICLQDCVLDVNTLKTYPHAPGYRMLTQLPFKWADRSVGCDPIKQWLLEVCDGQQLWVEVIRAAINATITERGGKMQRYLELIGAGGTGKGTILRLVQELVGKENYAITTLKQLEQNRFETASFYGKKLICITDSERYTGDVSVFKAITGYDDLRHEKKGVQQTGSFKFHGVVMVAANEAMQSTDYTNATARRRLSMPFNHVIPPHQRRDLIAEFTPYLPGLLSWVLEMPFAQVQDLFVDTNSKVPSLAAFSKEILMETNPLANWADECLYYDPKAITGIGDISQNPEEFLYPNYAQWASNNGQGTMNKQRFSSTLLNLLKAQLGIDATKRKTNKGRFITCVGIRKPGQNFPLLISTSDDLIQKGDDLVTTVVTTAVTAESIGSDGFLGSDDLFAHGITEESNECNSMLSPVEQNEGDRSSLEANPTIESVLGRQEVVTVTTDEAQEVVTNSLPSQNNSVKASSWIGGCRGSRGSKEVTNNNSFTPPASPASPAHHHAKFPCCSTNPSVTQQMISNWDDRSSLGQLVLSLKVEELRQAVAGFNHDQLQHIKDAANSVWRLSVDSLAEYNGELVYIWECGQSNDVRIGTKTQPGVKVRRANLRPWLGI